MLAVLAWLRTQLERTWTPRTAENLAETTPAPSPPTTPSDTASEPAEASDRCPDASIHVWDRDTHLPLQAIRFRKLQHILAQRGLPPELVRYVLLLAEEARMLCVSRADYTLYGNNTNARYLRTPPLPSKLMHHFLLRVVVDIDSHDQGWSSDPHEEWRGTYQGSWTWWELSLDRPRHDEDGYFEVHRVHLTHNLHASRDFRRHTLTFRRHDPIAWDAQPGDVLSLWARTQYPGWTNFVRYARISVWMDWDA